MIDVLKGFVIIARNNKVVYFDANSFLNPQSQQTNDKY